MCFFTLTNGNRDTLNSTQSLVVGHTIRLPVCRCGCIDGTCVEDGIDCVSSAGVFIGGVSKKRPLEREG